jgi:phosphatidylserine/phosphatidylglycerophosphate/cardiolipin synthase-like enzyme
LLERVHRLAEELPEETVVAISRALAIHAEQDWPGRRSDVIQAVSHPHARAAADGLIATWQAEAPDVSPDALALALRGAAQGATQRRADQTLELVWTGPETQEIPLRQTAQALLDVIRAARNRLTIVSFAITRVASVEAELIRAAERGTSIRLIAESPSESGGQLSASAALQLSTAAQGRVQIFVWPLAHRPSTPSGRLAVLHAKCAIADDDVLFISSANLTGAALELNMELGVLIRGGNSPRKVRRHLDALIDKSLLIRA